VCNWKEKYLLTYLWRWALLEELQILQLLKNWKEKYRDENVFERCVLFLVLRECCFRCFYSKS
jgi:hypothetical protein